MVNICLAARVIKFKLPKVIEPVADYGFFIPKSKNEIYDSQRMGVGEVSIDL